MPVRQAAKLLGVSVGAANNWMRQWRNDRKIGPSPIRGHRPALLVKHAEWLLAIVKKNDELTLQEIRVMLRSRGVNVSLWTIWNFCRQYGIRLKRTRRRVHTQAKKDPKGRRPLTPHDHV